MEDVNAKRIPEVKITDRVPCFLECLENIWEGFIYGRENGQMTTCTGTSIDSD